MDPFIRTAGFQDSSLDRNRCCHLSTYPAHCFSTFRTPAWQYKWPVLPGYFGGDSEASCIFQARRLCGGSRGDDPVLPLGMTLSLSPSPQEQDKSGHACHLAIRLMPPLGSFYGSSELVSVAFIRPETLPSPVPPKAVGRPELTGQAGSLGNGK